jgi:ribulose 1,5-bisphosphate synthetase/thiazole synthase
MQENTESAIKNGQSSKTGNIGYTRRRNWQHRVHKKKKNTTQYVLDTTIHKQKHNTICVRHHYTQTKTQHNMCWTPLYTNKNTTQYVLDTTIHKQKHNTICVRHHYTQRKTQHNIQTALYCWMCIMLYESSFQIIIHSSTKLRRDMVMLDLVLYL